MKKKLQKTNFFINHIRLFVYQIIIKNAYKKQTFENYYQKIVNVVQKLTETRPSDNYIIELLPKKYKTKADLEKDVISAPNSLLKNTIIYFSILTFIGISISICFEEVNIFQKVQLYVVMLLPVLFFPLARFLPKLYTTRHNELNAFYKEIEAKKKSIELTTYTGPKAKLKESIKLLPSLLFYLLEIQVIQKFNKMKVSEIYTKYFLNQDGSTLSINCRKYFDNPEKIDFSFGNNKISNTIRKIPKDIDPIKINIPFKGLIHSYIEPEILIHFFNELNGILFERVSSEFIYSFVNILFSYSPNYKLNKKWTFKFFINKLDNEICNN